MCRPMHDTAAQIPARLKGVYRVAKQPRVHLPCPTTYRNIRAMELAGRLPEEWTPNSPLIESWT